MAEYEGRKSERAYRRGKRKAAKIERTTGEYQGRRKARRQKRAAAKEMASRSTEQGSSGTPLFNDLLKRKGY